MDFSTICFMLSISVRDGGCTVGRITHIIFISEKNDRAYLILVVKGKCVECFFNLINLI